MKKNLLSLIFVLFHFSVYPQLTENQKVIQELLYYIKPNDCSSDFYYIENYNLKTYFNKEEFKDQTLNGSNIPEHILKELEEFPSKNAELNTNMFDVSKMSSLRIYKKEEKRPNGLVYSFTNPKFDKSKMHCVITVVKSLTKDSFTANDYFLVKVYNKWVILETFNYVTT